MIIIHKIDDFLFELFSDNNKDIETLKTVLIDFYSVGNTKPIIEIKDGFVHIEIDTEKIDTENKEYSRLVSLCESSKFNEAKDFALKLINTYPTVSEYHRILGQVYSELGDQDEGINSLIDALKWNPKNEYALLMIGNIFAKFKNDIETAMTYYNQVLAIKPDDNIALNNIGANLMQLGRTEEAKNYFNKALKINPDYPNTFFAISMVADIEKDFWKSFEYALTAIEKNKSRDQLYGNSFRQAIEASKKLCSQIDGMKIVKDFISKLSYETDKKIKIEEDNTIPTAAKIEFAENHNRDYHVVKYKSKYPAVEHLIMHELMHLELAHEARQIGENQLFVTNDSYKTRFFYSLEKEAKQYKKQGFSEESISKMFQGLFDGMNRQVYNTPIDLFIEDRIYEKEKELHPFQFLSMLAMTQEGIDATTRKEIVELAPKSILSKSKIYNLVNALHFKSLYKVDLTHDHKPTKLELNQAEEFYKEFIDYRKDKEPAEEYEIVQHWAEDLKLDGYFELMPENKNKRKSLDDIVSEIERDPFGLDSKDSSKERKMKKFLEEHEDKDINMAVAMYMVGAIEKLKDLKKETVKKIAFEFATLGMGGISPEKDGYTVPYFKNEKFSGYKALSYYYVSWAIAMPEMLSQLQMPFDKEYSLAKTMINL